MTVWCLLQPSANMPNQQNIHPSHTSQDIRSTGNHATNYFSNRWNVFRQHRQYCSSIFLICPMPFLLCVANWSSFNPLISTLKPKSNGPSYSNMVIGTLAVDRWAVTFGTARMGLGWLQPHQVPSSLYQM